MGESRRDHLVEREEKGVGLKGGGAGAPGSREQKTLPADRRWANLEDGDAAAGRRTGSMTTHRKTAYYYSGCCSIDLLDQPQQDERKGRERAAERSLEME